MVWVLITQRSQVQILPPLQVNVLVRGGFRRDPGAASGRFSDHLWAIVGRQRAVTANLPCKRTWSRVYCGGYLWTNLDSECLLNGQMIGSFAKSLPACEAQ